MSLGDTFKKLLGGAPPKPKARPAPSKTALPASRRAEMIDWAMQVYRGKAVMGRGMLDQSLAGFRAKPPRLNDPDALARMLRIHRAETEIRRLMNHREWRYLILAGLRQLLIDAPPEGDAHKPKRRTIIRR
ncbi:MAG: hypothetical protein FJX59_19565 [Alphaproteobacteria bacterium]|nr:hypothetical protein [Alphaproteobacteria bacterium]